MASIPMASLQPSMSEPPPAGTNNETESTGVAPGGVSEEEQGRPAGTTPGGQRTPTKWRIRTSKKPATHRYVGDDIAVGTDSARRKYKMKYKDCYVSPENAKFDTLVVQCTDAVFGSDNGGSTWRRQTIESVSPYHLAVANWSFSGVKDLDVHPSKWDQEDWKGFLSGYVQTIVALLPMMLIPRFHRGKRRNGGNYDPFPYEHYTCAKAYRNRVEDGLTPIPRNTGQYGTSDAPTSNPTPALARDSEVRIVGEEGISRRILLPRQICVLNDAHKRGYIRRDVQDLMAETKKPLPDYTFVAYTDTHFPSVEDKKKLHKLAQQATRDAKHTCYWISAACVDSTHPFDGWNISDVIRGASKFVIALPELENKTLEERLQEWSNRLWTFPEILLSPGTVITTYTAEKSDPGYQAQGVEKSTFPAHYLKDVDNLIARQLFDHYLGTQFLSGLELTTIALQCLSCRATKGEYLAGDYSYALMGLLRQRPEVEPTDTPFLAFARLSLANHNEQLLERLICILPRSTSQAWHCIDDAYGASLSDIIPHIQVAGIGVWHPNPMTTHGMVHNETHPEDIVIIDGCRGATIHWDKFQRVAHTMHTSWTRLAAKIILRLNIAILIAGAVLANVGAKEKKKNETIAGGVLLAYSIVIVIFSPFIVKTLYMGKFWDTQPWLFGFEGYLDIKTIEEKIFGASLNRLRWTHAGSPLSAFEIDDDGTIMTVDPYTSSDETKRYVQRGADSQPGEQKVFTLVDTGSMTVTVF